MATKWYEVRTVADAITHETWHVKARSAEHAKWRVFAGDAEFVSEAVSDESNRTVFSVTEVTE